MSTINTNGINTNYPVPGQNQSSQGFRNNFTAIVTNLNVAATEITDLQNNVVLKAALANTTLNNDMANTLISNASTRSFRATTYNLGNALSGTVAVNASLADVQYGTVSGNVTLQFGNWSPTGTQQSIQLQLAVSNANAVISFPSSVISTNISSLENYANVASIATVTVPYGVSQLNYTITTRDCGNSLYITPTNRPYQTTEIQVRTPPPTGLPGDVEGAVAVDAISGQISVSSTVAIGNYIIANSTSGVHPSMAIVFTGNTDAANSNIVAGTTYYVSSIANSTAFTISSSFNGTELDVGSTTNSFNGNPVSYFYVCTSNFNATTIGPLTVANTFSSNNEILLSSVTGLVNNAPVVFSGTTIGGLAANTIYYIVNVISGNTTITVSQTRSTGTAGSVLALTTASTGSNLCTATSYNGSNIWTRLALTSW